MYRQATFAEFTSTVYSCVVSKDSIFFISVIPRAQLSAAYAKSQSSRSYWTFRSLTKTTEIYLMTSVTHLDFNFSCQITCSKDRNVNSRGHWMNILFGIAQRGKRLLI